MGILILQLMAIPAIYTGFRRYILTKFEPKKQVFHAPKPTSPEVVTDIPQWLREWEIDNFESGFHPEARIPTLLDQEIPQNIQTMAIAATNKILYALETTAQKSIFLCDIIKPYLPDTSQNIAYFYYDLFCQLNEKIDIYDSVAQIKKRLVGVSLSSLILKIEFIEFNSSTLDFKPSTIEFNLNSFNLSLDTQLFQLSSWLIFLNEDTNSKITASIDINIPLGDRKLRQKIIDQQTLLKQLSTSIFLESQIEKTQEFYRINNLDISEDQLIQDLIKKSRHLAALSCKTWRSIHKNRADHARQPLEYLRLDINNFDAFTYEMMKSKNIKLSLENPQITLIGYKEFFAPLAFYKTLIGTKFTP